MIRIVVVDDHAVVRSGLRLLLEAEEDMKVVGDAGNARDAVFTAGLMRDILPVIGLSGYASTNSSTGCPTAKPTARLSACCP